MKYCPNCRSEADERYSFCTECAALLVEKPEVMASEVLLNRSILQQIGQINVEGASRGEIEAVVADYLMRSDEYDEIKRDIEGLVRQYLQDNTGLTTAELRKVESRKQEEYAQRRTGMLDEWDGHLQRLIDMDRDINDMKKKAILLNYEMNSSRPVVEVWSFMWVIGLIGLIIIVAAVIFAEEVASNPDIVGGILIGFYVLLFILLHLKSSTIDRSRKEYEKKIERVFPQISSLKNSIDDLMRNRMQTAHHLERLAVELKTIDNVLEIEHDTSMFAIPHAPELPLDL